MKKIFSIIIFFFAIEFATGEYAITTKVNSEIDPGLKKEVSKPVSSLFNSIRKNRMQEFKSLLSDALIHVSSNQRDQFFAKLRQLFLRYNFEIMNEYYTTVEKSGKNKPFTIVPSLSDKRKLIINNLLFYTKESYNVFLKSDNKEGVQYLLFISLGLYGKDWKINIIQVGDYSVNNMTPIELFKEGLKLKKQEKIIAAGLYALAGRRMLRPAKMLQYPDEQKYNEQFKAVYAAVKHRYTFPIKIKNNIKILSVQLELVKQGIVPEIIYITNTPVDNKNKIEKEAKEIEPAIYKIFPDIKTEFSYMILRSYNEMPLDRKKNYHFYRTIIKIK